MEARPTIVVRSRLTAPPVRTLNPFLPHEARDPLGRHPLALCLEVGVDAGPAVDPAVGLPALTHPDAEGGVGVGPGGRRALEPSVVAAPGETKDAGHRADGEDGPMRPYLRTPNPVWGATSACPRNRGNSSTDLALHAQCARLVRGARDAASDATVNYGRCWFDGCDIPQERATET